MWEGGNRPLQPPSLSSPYHPTVEARDVVAQNVHLSGWPGVEDRGDGVIIRTGEVDPDPPCCVCMHRLTDKINDLPPYKRIPILVACPILYGVLWYALVRLCYDLDVEQPFIGLIILCVMINLVVVTSGFFFLLIKNRVNDSEDEGEHVEIVGLGATLTVVGEGVVRFF